MYKDKYLDILGVRIEVLHIPSHEMPSGESASCELDLRRITLPNDVSDDQYWELFFHETTHAALRISGLAEVLTKDLEEGVCTTLGFSNAIIHKKINSA